MPIGTPEGVRKRKAKFRKVLKISRFSELFLFLNMQNKVVLGIKDRIYSWDFLRG